MIENVDLIAAEGQRHVKASANSRTTGSITKQALGSSSNYHISLARTSMTAR